MTKQKINRIVGSIGAFYWNYSILLPTYLKLSLIYREIKLNHFNLYQLLYLA